MAKQVSDDLEEQGQDEEEAAGVGERSKEPAAAKLAVKADGDGNVVVSHDEEEAPQTRKERRAAWKRHEEDARRLREENSGLQRQLQELHTTVMSRLSTPQPAQQPANGQDAYLAYMSQLDERQEMIVTAMKGAAPEQVAAYKKQFYDINRERDRATKLAAREEALQVYRQEQAQRQQQGGGEAAIINAEYPDVIGYRGPGGANTAYAWADARYRQLIAEGEPSTLATIRKAMDEAATRFQLRQPTRPAASAIEQQRMGGVSAQAGGRAGGREITLSPDQQKMARYAFPDMDDHAAFAKLAELLRKQERESA